MLYTNQVVCSLVARTVFVGIHCCVGCVGYFVFLEPRARIFGVCAILGIDDVWNWRIYGLLWNRICRQSCADGKPKVDVTKFGIVKVSISEMIPILILRKYIKESKQRSMYLCIYYSNLSLFVEF